MSSPDPLKAIIDRLAEKAKANELKKRGRVSPKRTRTVGSGTRAPRGNRTIH